MVFAQLCLNQHEVVINFLSGVTINGRNGLDIVLTSWTTYHSDFQGQYQQKVRYRKFATCDVIFCVKRSLALLF